MPWPCHAQRKSLYFENTGSTSLSKSAKIVLSKSIFYVKNRRNFFKKKIIQEYQFRRPFFKKTFFSNSNFWTTLFSKIMPYFWRTGAPRILKIQRFPLSMAWSWQKACILGPTIFKIPQPNWHYYSFTYLRLESWFGQQPTQTQEPMMHS